MIKYMYAIKDDVAGTFDFYGTFVNDNVAKRTFITACSKTDDVPVEDLSLYLIGDFDTETGNLNPSEIRPDFLMRGEKRVEI